MDTKVIKSDEVLNFSTEAIIHKKSFFNKKEYKLELLQKVSILTTDQGPVFDDVALAFFLGEIVLILPSEHRCYQKIYDDISESLSLNYKNVIKAMSSAENEEFIIWEK